jgi:hypothetical protein
LRYGLDLVPVGHPGSPYLFQIRNGLRDAAMLLNGCEAYQIMAIAKAAGNFPETWLKWGYSGAGRQS